MIASCGGEGTTPITKIDAAFTGISLTQGEEIQRNLTITASADFTKKDLVFKVKDDSVAKITFEEISLSNIVTFKINGVSVGETTLTIETKDGSVKSKGYEPCKKCH